MCDLTLKWIKHIFAISIAVVFLLSTSGFTIYSHHCSSSNSSYTVSIFKSLATCSNCGSHIKQNIEKETCCASKTSCSINNTENNCCSTQEQFLKIVVDYNIPSEKYNTEITTIEVIQIELLLQENYTEPILFPICNFSLPPPKHGAEIVILLNQQKADPLLYS